MDPRPDAADADRPSDIERATAHTRGQLHQRGVRAFDDDRADGLAEIADAVDAFELHRAARGGDSFTNAPDSDDPDDPTMVIPAREDGEGARDYARRVREAAERMIRRAD